MQPRTEPLEQFYELEEEIGNGQSAVVRRVLEKASGRSFAAKLVRRRRGAAAQAEARREASALAALKHPNLVALHEAFEAPQHVVFVIELVCGGELEAVLDAHGGNLQEEQAADVVRQVLCGLEHMHQRGIAHLDLKPENVMVSKLHPPWQVKLIDFGLSREVAGGDERALQGTPEFLAPEAVNFEPLSLATDIWAVGVITYLTLSGISPFLGEDKQATFCNIVSGEYDIEKLSHVSPSAPALIARMLVPTPRKRPSASDCLSDSWLAETLLPVTQVINDEHQNKHRAKRRWKSWFHVISLSRYLTSHPASHESSLSSDKSAISDDDVGPCDNPASEICDSLSSMSYNDNQTQDDNSNLIAQIKTAPGSNFKSINFNDVVEQKVSPAASSQEDTCATDERQSDIVRNNSTTLDEDVEACETPAIEPEESLEISDDCSPLLQEEEEEEEEKEEEEVKDSTPRTAAEKLSAALAGSELEATDSRGETPIFWAARQGNVEAVRLLTTAGAKIDAQNKLGETCLHVACRYGHASVVGVLCLLPFDLDHRELEGETALHAASARGHSECVRRLVDAGASLDVQDRRHGATPLMMALRRHQSRVALLLLHAGADLELTDAMGDTPLHAAAHEGLLAVAQTLCAYGCRVDVANESGLMPLHLAARRGHTELVRCLCLAGCDVERRNGDGIKAEITALKHGHHETAELLARLTNVRQRDEYIRQLIPGPSSLSRVTVRVLGHSGVGKTALLDTLGAGLLASLFRRSKGAVTAATASRSHPSSPSKTHIEMDVTARTREDALSFDSHQGGTRGVDVRLLSVAGVGEVSAWEFSGQEAYLPVYHHVLGPGAGSAVHVLVCNLEDPPAVRLQQCLFWLSFLQARLTPSEPFGLGGSPRNPVRVVLVATHADTARCPRASAQAGGDYVSTEIEWLLEQLISHVTPALSLHPQAIVLDSNVPGSAGIRALKNCLLEARQQTSQVRPRGSGLLDATLRWLPSWRRLHAAFPVAQWAGFAHLVRTHVNPLTGEEHLKELLHQLIFLGEAVWLRSPGLVILCPRWLGGEVLGQLLSPEFFATARATGCYTSHDFQAAFPQGGESRLVLHVLEALDLCVQCENDGELEYEFPCFNLIETLDGLWDPEDPRYSDAVYAGVRIRGRAPAGGTHQLACLFPRLQVQLRRAAQAAQSNDPDTDLYQWLHGSKLCTGLLESLVTLERGGDIEIKVRGPTRLRLACFYFLEDILAVLEQVIEAVVPGLPPERRVLSCEQLRAHAREAFSWPPEVVAEAALAAEEAGGLTATLTNPVTGNQESLLDLLAFGATEVNGVLALGPELPVTSLGSVARQSLCAALDPPEALGRDWCLLAVSLGLGERIAALEGSAGCAGNEAPRPSPTSRLLEEWARAPKTATIGVLVSRLRELGREDAALNLLRLAPSYRALVSADECWSDDQGDEEELLLDTSSSNLSR